MTPPKRKTAARRKTAASRSRRAFSYEKWAAALVPDFSGMTQAGIHMTLITWLLNGQWYMVTGWGADEVESQASARREAISRRAATGK